MIKQPYQRWTQDTETAFLLALKQTGTVRAAADAVGRCVGSAYKRRQRRAEFRERWDAMVAQWQAQWIEQRGTKIEETAPRERWDGWSAVRKRAFLRALADTGEIQKAAERVGMSRSSVARLKARSPEFAQACEKALRVSLPCLEQIAYERAVEGWDEDVVVRGEVVGTRRRWSERLLADLLKAEQAARKAERVAEAKRGPVEAPASREDMTKVLLKRIEFIEQRRKARARAEAIEAAERWEAFVRAGGFAGMGERDAGKSVAGDRSGPIAAGWFRPASAAAHWPRPASVDRRANAVRRCGRHRDWPCRDGRSAPQHRSPSRRT